MNHAPLKPLAAILAVAGISVSLGACFEDSAASEFSAATDDVPFMNDSDSAVSSGPGFVTKEAGSPTIDTIIGSPLCRVTKTSCQPDPILIGVDGGAGAGITGATELVCSALPVADAGAAVSDGALSPDAANVSEAGTYEGRACRVGLDINGYPTPSCERVGTGKDGSLCSEGSDCAGGFDCVSVSSGVKQCRRYCCSGSCGDKLPETRFCDIAPLANENRLVPVCLPIKKCELLGADCAMGETCAIVTDTGMTSCVAVGKAAAGESCESAHCADGLNCLGQVGAKKCYQICTMSGSDCASPQICKGNSLFKDEGFGVCQDL